MAAIMRSEMALCPQPAHSVDLPPRYSKTVSPMRFTFGPSARFTVVVAILQALLGRKLVCNGARVGRQSVVVQNAAQLHHLFGGNIQLQQAGQLSIAVLL